MDISDVKKAAKRGHAFLAFDEHGKQIEGSIGHYEEHDKPTAEKVISKKRRSICINGVSVVLKEKKEEIWFFVPVDMLIEKENLQIIEDKKIPEQVQEIDLSKYGFDIKENENSSQRLIG